MTTRAQATAVSLLLLLAAASAAPAERPSPEDPVPPGATAKILPVSGKVLELRGLASGVAGKAAAIEAVLKELGAKVTEQEIRIDLSADVLFDFDKADLRREATPALEKLASVLKTYPAATTTIEGHTDSKGGRRYNQDLSERRAASVRGWLGSHGVGNPMTTRGWGETKPAVPNSKPGGADNPEGRQKNRRVEITLERS